MFVRSVVDILLILVIIEQNIGYLIILLRDKQFKLIFNTTKILLIKYLVELCLQLVISVPYFKIMS